jgi:hypothetical protein
MFKNTDELKEFIIWAKEQGLKSVKTDNISFEVSDYELVKKFTSQTTVLSEIEKPAESRVDVIRQEAKQKDEDEELLFWSSK